MPNIQSFHLPDDDTKLDQLLHGDLTNIGLAGRSLPFIFVYLRLPKHFAKIIDVLGTVWELVTVLIFDSGYLDALCLFLVLHLF